jgi:hypothetical protein
MKKNYLNYFTIQKGHTDLYLHSLSNSNKEVYIREEGDGDNNNYQKKIEKQSHKNIHGP